MKLHTHIKPISYLKSHAAQIMAERNERHELMIINQNGTAPLVVINARTHQAHEDTQALQKLLAMGQRDIEKSQFRDAEDVFASITRLDPT